MHLLSHKTFVLWKKFKSALFIVCILVADLFLLRNLYEMSSLSPGMLDLSLGLVSALLQHHLTEYAAQLLLQAVNFSHLDYFNNLVAGLTACRVKALKMAKNAAARLALNQPKTAHDSTCILISGHQHSTHVLYLNSLSQVATPSHSLQSANELLCETENLNPNSSL